MPDTVILRPIGRVSEPSHLVAPKGALLTAENCVMREPGVLSPVPPLERISQTDAPANSGARQISPVFRNGASAAQLCHMTSGGTTNQGTRSSADMSVEITYNDYDGSASSIAPYTHSFGLFTFYPMYLSRDNLYLADQRGVYKWLSTDDTTLEPVWDVPSRADTGADAAGTNQWLPNNSHVRYRSVVRLRDANGLIRRGAPSAPYIINNTSGGNRVTNVIVYISEHVYDNTSVEAIEVYRTRTLANTVALPNEYYLVSEIDPADLTDTGDSFYYGLVDETDDSDLGAALYTNESQGGDTASNVAPPEHLYQASFRGHMFWANVAEKEYSPQLKLTVATSTLERSPTLSGTTSIGSPTFTATALDNLEVGMITTDNGIFPAGSYVTTITGAGPYTVTVSQNATASSASPKFSDAVYVYWGDGSSSRFPISSVSGSDPMSELADDAYLDIVAIDGTELGYDSPYTAVFSVSSVHRVARQGTAQIWVSNPSNFDGVAVADLDTGTGAPTSGGTDFLPALHRSRICWSKYQEPEVTTSLSFQDVGNAAGIGGGDIVGLGALRDALIILKRDGIYRLTGDNGNWRVDELDTGVGIIGGRSTAVMDNAVYTLGETGILRITTTGVENLSDGIVNDWLREAEYDDARIEDVREYMQDNNGYHPESLFAAADPVHREYVLACEGADSLSSAGNNVDFLVYNAKTKAFTTWVLHESYEYYFSCLSYADANYWSTSNDQVPGIVFARKVSNVDTSGALFIADNRQVTRDAVFSSYTQDVRFRALHEGDPTHIKLWSSVVWDTDGNAAPSGTVTAVFQDGEGGADVTQTVNTSDDDEEIRIWPPLDVVRSTKLVVGLQAVGLTVYGLRATYASSGRESPL